MLFLPEILLTLSRNTKLWQLIILIGTVAFAFLRRRAMSMQVRVLQRAGKKCTATKNAHAQLFSLSKPYVLVAVDVMVCSGSVHMYPDIFACATFFRDAASVCTPRTNVDSESGHFQIRPPERKKSSTNPITCGRGIFWIRKKLRIQKYSDTCGGGLKLSYIKSNLLSKYET